MDSFSSLTKTFFFGEHPIQRQMHFIFYILKIAPGPKKWEKTTKNNNKKYNQKHTINESKLF